MNNPENPELVATVESVDANGSEKGYGDKVVGVGVRQDTRFPDGVVDLDIREFTRGTNLIVRLSMPELVAAIASATLNCDSGK